MRVATLRDRFPVLSETFIINQQIGLIDRGHDVRIFAKKPADDIPVHSVIEQYGLIDRTKYSSAPEGKVSELSTILRTLPELTISSRVPISTLFWSLQPQNHISHQLINLKTFKDDDPFDIYHAHFGKDGLNHLGVAKATEKPFIVSFYGYDASRVLKNNPDIYDELFPEVDACTVLSEDMRDDLIAAGCPAEKTHIVPLPIDTSKFTFKRRERDENEQINLLTIARFVEKKGLRYAIDAVAELKNDYDIKYRIAGDGDRRSQIESRIEENGLEDTVELLGWQDQDEIAELINKSHIFVLPSVTASDGDKEGTPTVLLEAQSAGLPVVSTYHAGIPEIVQDGESGILVPEKNVDEIVNSLRYLLSNPNKWATMGSNGRAYIEQTHSIPSVANQLDELYNSLH